MTRWVRCAIVMGFAAGGCGGKHDPEPVATPATAPATVTAPPVVSPLRGDVDKLLADVHALETELAATDAAIRGFAAQVAAATTEPARVTVRGAIDTQRKALAELQARRAAILDRTGDARTRHFAAGRPDAEHRASEDEERDLNAIADRLSGAKTQLAELDGLAVTASDTLQAAQVEADRTDAKAKLDQLRKEHDAAQRRGR